jgi:hypothetical protein
MAILDGNFIKGSIERSVFKQHKALQILQSAPGKGGVKQTASTKKAAKLFGGASILGEVIRKMFENVIMDYYDGTMVTRLTAKLRMLLSHHFDKETETYAFTQNSFSRLNGFDFNLNSPVNESLWLVPESNLENNTLTVTVPEMKIPGELKFPENISSCTIDIMVNFYNLENGLQYWMPEMKHITVDKSQGISDRQELIFTVPDGCLCIAAIGLRYSSIKYGHPMPYNSKDFHPAGICAAQISPGSLDMTTTKKWFKRKACFTAASDRSSTTGQASLR